MTHIEFYAIILEARETFKSLTFIPMDFNEELEVKLNQNFVSISLKLVEQIIYISLVLFELYVIILEARVTFKLLTFIPLFGNT